MKELLIKAFELGEEEINFKEVLSAGFSLALSLGILFVPFFV